jgi:chromosome segregation ATPase
MIEQDIEELSTEVDDLKSLIRGLTDITNELKVRLDSHEFDIDVLKQSSEEATKEIDLFRKKDEDAYEKGHEQS